jgi:predicted heme/steroid binding protein
MKIIHHIIAPLISLVVLVVQRNTINFLLMGFFRDMGRIKARNRRLKNANAIASSRSWEIILKRDDPLEGLDFDTENDAQATFTLAELQEFGNGKEGKKILLSIFGRVYDVSSGSKFYGEGGNYHMFAGRDVTRALCAGCLKEDCLIRNTDGLSNKELAEGKRWLSFFQLHDKYSYVGYLEGDRESWFDALIENYIVEQEEEIQELIKEENPVDLDDDTFAT